MYKNKIALKLFAYFAIALLTLSLVIGGIFTVLFKNYTVELQRAEMEKRAAQIALNLGELMPMGGNGRAGGGYGAYLRFISDIAMSDVWIVDENLNLITRGPGMGSMGRTYVYADLPADADKVVTQVFTGQTAFSEDFSDLLQTPTLTVGTPILSQGRIIGVVLLHSPVEGVNQAVRDGYTVLGISILLALILALALSVWFSIGFTKPLNQMKSTALLLAEGDYKVQTGIRLNDELGQLAVALDTLSQRLQQASQDRERLEQLRSDFVANISHELRTPITVIRGSMEALYDGVVRDPEQVKSYQEQILFETRFLQRLVGDLLDLSRLQNTDFAMESQDVNLAQVIDDLTRSLRPMAAEQRVLLEVDQDGSLDHFQGDYGRLRQMLMIFLDNAIKFSPQPGLVKISLKDRVISIIDNGIGIEPQDLPYIFDRFYKSRSEQNKSGTGLGLAIARQIAQGHDILISVDSQPGHTEFRLQF